MGRRGRGRGAPEARGPGSRSGSVPARRSSVSATAAICDSTPRPRRSSQTFCSSCCCASPKTWSPSPRSSSAPLRSATPRPPPCAPPTGPAPSARWTPGTPCTRRGAAGGDLQEVGRSPGTQRGTGGTHPRGATCELRGFFGGGGGGAINWPHPRSSAVGAGTFPGQSLVSWLKRGTVSRVYPANFTLLPRCYNQYSYFTGKKREAREG